MRHDGGGGRRTERWDLEFLVLWVLAWVCSVGQPPPRTRRPEIRYGHFQLSSMSISSCQLTLERVGIRNQDLEPFWICPGLHRSSSDEAALHIRRVQLRPDGTQADHALQVQMG